ncbi:hypothetical protein ISN44_As12g034890 [Arabidopsis suecica]|uniref:Uncharacterized protein n=1 Tax=Arabidopsis suecica TaxID=45249 RepID=A0A8T1YQK2_ARASU|nr:hypothetical protein ISN44_As12g034890 [Arabidopsis suecica]
MLPRRYREYEGSIYGSYFAKYYLTKRGPVLDSVCPLTYALDRPRQQHRWEEYINPLRMRLQLQTYWVMATSS